jgi:DNA repair exonuclease SbcCD ATPase subunit
MSKKEELFERFMASPVFLKVAEQIEQEEAAREAREEAAAKLAKLKATREAILEPMRRELKEADAAVKEAEELLQAAKSRRGDAQSRSFTAMWNHDQSVRSLEAFLKESAPQRLKDELEQLKAHKEFLMMKSIDSESFPDIPSGIGLSEEQVQRIRQRPSSYRERLRQIDDVDQEIERVTEKILGGN